MQKTTLYTIEEKTKTFTKIFNKYFNNIYIFVIKTFMKYILINILIKIFIKIFVNTLGNLSPFNLALHYQIYPQSGTCILKELFSADMKIIYFTIILSLGDLITDTAYHATSNFLMSHKCLDYVLNLYSNL